MTRFPRPSFSGLLLVVWRGSESAEGALALQHVASWAERCGLPVERGRAWLAVTEAPARWDGRGRAWLYAGSAAERLSESRGPDVQVDEAGLTATVGPFPEQPIYYRWEPRARYAVVGSRLAAVVRAVGGRPLNLRRVTADAARLVDTDPGSTPFEGVLRIVPGERIEVGASGLASRFDPPRAGSTYLQGSVPEIAEGLRRVAAEATERAMSGTDRVAVFVGGGLDSSGVLALAVQAARRQGGPGVEAIALDYEAPGDDRPHLRELAQWLGVTPTRLDPADAAPFFLSAMCVDAQPGAVSSDCLGLLTGEAARARGTEVALSGSWGDEVLGAAHGFSAMARRGRWLRATLAAARFDTPWQSTPAEQVRDLVLLPAVRHHVPNALRQLRRRRLGAFPWLTASARSILASAASPTFEPHDDTPDGRIASLSASHDTRSWADSCGQFSVATGCESRDVFFDIELLKFMARVDPVLYNVDDTYRGLYKRAMRGVLPEGLRTRRDKADFEPAIARAARAGDGLDVIADLGSATALASLGLVDPRRFRPFVDEAIAAARRGPDLGPRWENCWRTLAVERFVRLWGGSRLPPEDAPC